MCGGAHKSKDSPTPLFLKLLLLTSQTLSLKLTLFRKLFFTTFFQSSHCVETSMEAAVCTPLTLSLLVPCLRDFPPSQDSSLPGWESLSSVSPVFCGRELRECFLLGEGPPRAGARAVGGCGDRPREHGVKGEAHPVLNKMKEEMGASQVPR